MESALGFVVGKLGPLIQNETALVFNFKQDFKWLKMRLALLTDAVQSADGNDTHSEAFQQWIEDVRDTLWDAQDILDEYSLRTLYYRHLTSFPYKMELKSRKIKERYKMGRKIRDIKDRVKSIMDIANELKLIREAASTETATPSRTVQSEGKLKKPSMTENGSFPVAVITKARHIQELLDDPAVQIIAIVGMGGIGKTFLMEHVYEKVKHLYDDSVWLYVSQTYSLEQLQRGLALKLNLSTLASSGNGVDCTVGAEIIHGHLKDKKFLVVLDDVWKATEEDDLLRSLGISIAVNKQCKIIVTSRNKEIFSHLHPFIYEMSLLSAEDSWKLFSAYAFSNSTSAQREILGREIEKECGRLPLAIKTVASSLAKATIFREWESKLHQLKKVRGFNLGDPILHILKLSYYWLPSFLKPCFFYLSFFPEDEEIDCEYLVYLWIAEGFIPQTEDQVDTARDYLRQLANLCLVDVLESTNDPYFTGVVGHRCRLHDLVLELAIHLSKENKSAFLVEEAFTEDKQSSYRRILLAKKRINATAIEESKLCCAKFVRTLSLSRNPSLHNIPPLMLSNVRVLRVLDLSHTRILTLPKCIGDMKLLRILNLSHTDLVEVPQCVRKLKSLSFLDVSGCIGLTPPLLPLWIGELVSLQHLNIEGCHSLALRHIPKGVSKLMSLRTLRSGGSLKLSVENDEYFWLKDVGNMACLQEISIKVQNEVEIRSLEEGILGGLVKMRTLELNCELQRFAPIPISLTESIKAMKDLQDLTLVGNFAVPGLIRGFDNLRVLYFNGCDCSDLYPAMETMGNLTELTLAKDKHCKEFPKAFGKRGAFPNIRVFRIENFEALTELPEMKDGAMASLESLEVWGCRLVRNVPRGFQRLERLRVFRFVGSWISDKERTRLKAEWSTVQAKNPHLTVEIS